MTNEELIKELREVTGGKLSSTNTPNHLRLAAADRIEQLLAINKAYRDLARELENEIMEMKHADL